MVTATAAATVSNANGDSKILANSEVSRQNADAFCLELIALREKYAVKDLLIVFQMTYMDKGVEEEQWEWLIRGDPHEMKNVTKDFIQRDDAKVETRIKRASKAHVRIRRF